MPLYNNFVDLVSAQTVDGQKTLNGGAIFNSGLANVDFNISSDTITNFFHVDANGMAGVGSMGIGGPAYAPGGPLLWVYGETWQFVAGNVRTLVGESSSFFGGFQWIDATNIFQMGNGTLDQFQVDGSSNVVINEAGRAANFRVEGDTKANLFLITGSTDTISIDGTTNLTSLTASTPLKLDASKNIISSDIDLTTDVTGILPLANGGTGASLAALTSGTWTPTLTNTTNVAASTAYAGQYIRIGNVVSGSFAIDIDPTSASITTEVQVSLPVASNFGAFNDASGCGFCDSIFGLGCSISASVPNDRLRVIYIADSGAGNKSFFCTFSYTVI